MRIEKIGLIAAILLAAGTIVAAEPAQAAAKKVSTSNFLCKTFKLDCPRKLARKKPPAAKRATAKRSAPSSPKPAVAPIKASKASPTKSPKVKPDLKTQPVAQSAPTQRPVALGLIPKPRPKPPIAQAASQVRSADLPQQQPPSEKLQKKRPLSENPPPVTPSDDAPMAAAQCRSELVAMRVEFLIPDPIEAVDNCSVLDPVQLKSIETMNGPVDLPGQPIFNCRFARRFSSWVTDIAAPVTATLGQANLASLSTGPGYECRARNGDSTNKMSEHAFGNAVDIDGITLVNGKRIEISSVADIQDPHHRLLMAFRTAACGYFTTVLGPGANAAHASHFHFDLAMRGKNGDHRICE
jgi:hypothetical protein